MYIIPNSPFRLAPPPWLAPAALLAFIAAPWVLAGCSPQSQGAAQSAPSADVAPRAAENVSAANATDLDQPRTACWLLPGDAVSKVLGEALNPVADLGAIEYGNTSCNYYAPGKQPGEDAPRLTVTLDWHGYNLMAMDIPKAGRASTAAPYADIGDGALLDHGVLFVRVGKHSVAMDLRGDGDLHAIAAQLVAAAQPKMAR